MLKIKDNIDLKELEKYGFEQRLANWHYELDRDYYVVTIDIVDREIYIGNDYYDNDYETKIPNTLYDLIKDGLVEKVDN